MKYTLGTHLCADGKWAAILYDTTGNKYNLSYHEVLTPCGTAYYDPIYFSSEKSIIATYENFMQKESAKDTELALRKSKGHKFEYVDGKAIKYEEPF